MNVFFDGTCYEQQCVNLRAGFFSVGWRDALPTPPSLRSWWIISGQTPSNWEAGTTTLVACSAVETGPCYDHTQGTMKGKWAYVESTHCYGVDFHLISPTIVYNNASASFSYWYYMYGQSLSVAPAATLATYFSIDNGTTWTQLGATISGQQQAGPTDAWLQYTVVLDAVGGFGGPASVNNPISTVFRWIAVTGASGSGGNNDGYFGDFGIDDVLMTQNGAPTNYTAWIDPNCTFSGTCNPLLTTSGSTVQIVTGGGGGDGLSDGDIAGIVIGIVGGALLLCCLLCILLFILLFIISPKKPPEAGGGGEEGI